MNKIELARMTGQVPEASLAVISTQSGDTGNERPGARSGKTVLPSSIFRADELGEYFASTISVVRPGELKRTVLSAGFLPSRISTASLVASADSDGGFAPSQHFAPLVCAHTTPVPLNAAATMGTRGRSAFCKALIAPVP